jgi:hypothetical protein
MDTGHAPPPATTDPDTLVRRSTIAVVIAVALGAAYVSYGHAYDLIHSHGESGAAAVIGAGTVDGLIYASGMVLWSAARRKVRAPLLAYVGAGLGMVATIGANVAHGIGYGHIGALVSAWPALALIISYELLMRLMRSTPGGDMAADPPPQEDASAPCPHGVADTALDAAVVAFLHGRDCLKDEPSQRQLAAAFGVDRKKLAQALKEVAQPDAAEQFAEPAQHIDNGHVPATA